MKKKKHLFAGVIFMIAIVAATLLLCLWTNISGINASFLGIACSILAILVSVVYFSQILDDDLD